jgi:hypothetical protein
MEPNPKVNLTEKACAFDTISHQRTLRHIAKARRRHFEIQNVRRRGSSAQTTRRRFSTRRPAPDIEIISLQRF